MTNSYSCGQLVGDIEICWRPCRRRTWLNTGFLASLPSDLRPLCKECYVQTATNHSTAYGLRLDQTVDRIFLPAAKEVAGNWQGIDSISVSLETSALTQFSYYENSGGWSKYAGDSVDRGNTKWFTRSPYPYRLNSNTLVSIFMPTAEASSDYALGEDGNGTPVCRFSPVFCI